MSDNLRDRIAAVTARHSRIRNGEYHLCVCGWYADTPADTLREHPGHVAGAVIRELEADYILVPKGHTIARIRSAEKLGLTGDGE